MALAVLMTGFSGCQQPVPGDCIVKGTVKGVRNGTKVELLNEWDQYNVVGTGKVRNGAFEIYPTMSGPAHVYLYVHNGTQLKDFFLEPGTILVEATAEDESLLFTGATGTPTNDLYHKYLTLGTDGQDDSSRTSFRDSVMAQATGGSLALYFSQNGTAARALPVLDRLSPELAALPFVADLRDELTRRAKTEPRLSEDDPANFFVDMEFPDVDGNLVKLSDVVNDPANRYVLLDFWTTWCGPCNEDLPYVRDIYARYHGKGLEIYSVSEDVNEERWKPFMAEHGMTWINVHDTNPGRGNDGIWETYALHGVPTLILIDGNTGEIIARGSQLDLEALLSERLPEEI